MSRGPFVGNESDRRGKGRNQENDGCLEFGPSGRRRSKRVFRFRAKAWGLTRAVVCGPDGPACGPSMKKGTHEMKKGPPFRVSSPFERIQASMIRKRTSLKRAPFDRSRSSKTVLRPKVRKGRRRTPCRARDGALLLVFADDTGDVRTGVSVLKGSSSRCQRRGGSP